MFSVGPNISNYSASDIIKKIGKIKYSFVSVIMKKQRVFQLNFLVFSEDSYNSNIIQGIDIKAVYIGLPVSTF